ncbi:hypothetical protein MRX96_056310 [Rhipicephalus microplus]
MRHTALLTELPPPPCLDGRAQRSPSSSLSFPGYVGGPACRHAGFGQDDTEIDTALQKTAGEEERGTRNRRVTKKDGAAEGWDVF